MKKQCKCLYPFSQVAECFFFTSSPSTMVNGALEIWSVDPNAREHEISRTTFLKVKLFEAMSRSQMGSIALRVAGRLKKEITKKDRNVNGLTIGDFDDINAF